MPTQIKKTAFDLVIILMASLPGIFFLTLGSSVISDERISNLAGRLLFRSIGIVAIVFAVALLHLATKLVFKKIDIDKEGQWRAVLNSVISVCGIVFALLFDISASYWSDYAKWSRGVRSAEAMLDQRGKIAKTKNLLDKSIEVANKDMSDEVIKYTESLQEKLNGHTFDSCDGMQMNEEMGR